MAARYWVGGTANWDATAGTKWATTSGGAGGASVPTSSDDVFLDANSGVNTITITAAANCLTFVATGFTGTLAGTFALNVYGNTITFGSGMTISCTGDLAPRVSCTITSNGVRWAGSLNPIDNTANTFTISGDLTIGGDLIQTFADKYNGSKVLIEGTMLQSITAADGTSTFELIGSNSISLSPGLRNNLTINKSGGTVTIGNIAITNKDIIWIAGNTTVTAGTTLTLGNGVSTIDTKGDGSSTSLSSTTGINWDNISANGVVMTLLSDVRILGTFTSANASKFTGAFTIYLAGNWVMSNMFSAPTTTSSMVLNGTSTIGNVTSQYSTTINTSGTITFSSGTTFNYNTGTLTYVAGTVVTTGSTLNVNGSCTLNTNGITWNNVTFSTNGTITLSSNLTSLGIININLSGSTITINGFTIYCGGTFTMPFPNVIVQGTTALIMNGTGGITCGVSSTLKINLTINTSGTITFSGSLTLSGITFIYTSGTIVQSSFVLVLAGSMTIDTNSIVWNSVTTNALITFTSDFRCIDFIHPYANAITMNGFNLYVGGNFTMTGGQNVAGTTTIILNGTGTWSGSDIINSPLQINTSGTITISGSVSILNCTLTHIAGTVVTSGSTLVVRSNSTINTPSSSVSWNHITFLFGGTFNINSPLNATGTITVGVNGNLTFAGTSGFICGTFTCVTAGRTITFATGKTYTVTNDLIITGTVGSKISFVSTSTGALFNLQAGATQNVQNCNATWIDSSGGQTINSSSGTLNNTINWSIGGGNFFQIM